MPNQPLLETLQARRLAFVNVSASPSDPSRQLFRALLQCGAAVYAVRPGLVEIDGQRVYAHVRDIPATLDGAILHGIPHIIDRLLADCVDASIQHVWIDTIGQLQPAEVIARYSKRGLSMVSTISIADLVGSIGPRRKSRTTLKWFVNVLGLAT